MAARAETKARSERLFEQWLGETVVESERLFDQWLGETVVPRERRDGVVSFMRMILSNYCIFLSYDSEEYATLGRLLEVAKMSGIEIPPNLLDDLISLDLGDGIGFNDCTSSESFLMFKCPSMVPDVFKLHELQAPTTIDWIAAQDAAGDTTWQCLQEIFEYETDRNVGLSSEFWIAKLKEYQRRVRTAPQVLKIPEFTIPRLDVFGQLVKSICEENYCSCWEFSRSGFNMLQLTVEAYIFGQFHESSTDERVGWLLAVNGIRINLELENVKELGVMQELPMDVEEDSAYIYQKEIEESDESDYVIE
jgi:hypothetical protein